MQIYHKVVLVTGAAQGLADSQVSCWRAGGNRCR